MSLSLPSLRVDNFSQSLIEKTTKVRKSGLTFAAEAGTQRLRNVINKNVTWDEIEKTCTIAFNAGYTSVKLYFMMGLPTETMEDIEGIAETAQKVVDLYYSLPKRGKGKGVQVTISCACFVPKPHTPFEFVPMDTEEMLRAKQKHLLESVRSRKIKVNYHDSTTSFLEGVFAKGDRRLAPVIVEPTSAAATSTAGRSASSTILGCRPLLIWASTGILLSAPHWSGRGNALVPYGLRCYPRISGAGVPKGSCRPDHPALQPCLPRLRCKSPVRRSLL